MVNFLNYEDIIFTCTSQHMRIYMYTKGSCICKKTRLRLWREELSVNSFLKAWKVQYNNCESQNPINDALLFKNKILRSINDNYDDKKGTLKRTI